MTLLRAIITTLAALDEEASRLQRRRALLREARTRLRCGVPPGVVQAELTASGIYEDDLVWVDDSA
jgi:hypothetical protein